MNTANPDYHARLEQIQVYHKQLWIELRDLFHFYRALCDDHRGAAEAAVSRAALFLFFGAMETATRVMAAASLAISSDSEASLERRLTETESLFLQERVAEIRERDWSTASRTRFVSLESKLIGYPVIYARLFGIEIQIDRTSVEWQSFLRLKTLRDLGAHGSLLPTEVGPERVSAADLHQLLVTRRWYCAALQDLPWLAGAEARGEIGAIDMLLACISRPCTSQ